MRKPFYPQNNARKTVAPQEIYAEGDSNRKQLIPCVHCRCHTRHAPYAAAEKHSGCNPKIDGQAVKYLLPRREDAIIRKRYSEIIIFKGIARGGENVPDKCMKHKSERNCCTGCQKSACQFCDLVARHRTADNPVINEIRLQFFNLCQTSRQGGAKRYNQHCSAEVDAAQRLLERRRAIGDIPIVHEHPITCGVA